MIGGEEVFIEGEVTPILTDMEYLEESFKIWSEVVRCRNLLKEKQKEKILPDEECPKADGAKREEDMALPGGLFSKIREKDRLFWERVENGKRQNKQFIIEKIAEKYSFGLLEKKLVLFLLYIERASGSEKPESMANIMRYFDWSQSSAEGLKIGGCFRSDGPLMKSGIVKTYEGYSPRIEQRFYCLDTEFYFLVARALNGEASGIPDMEVVLPQFAEYEKGKCEDIGYVKTPEYTMDDVIIDRNTREELMLFLDALKNGHMEESGILKKIKKGTGNIFLFYGPPGTGKSMLAEAAASYLGKKVLVVEFPKITGRLFGDTDKNISKIFRLAKEENLMVIVDEADTLLYDRKYAQWEHDIRFVNVMLQELENFRGEMALTTNMDCLLDPALERRLTYKVKLSVPDTIARENIWEKHIPEEMKVAEGMNLGDLASRYDFSGGNIKNAVLNAVRKALSKPQKMLTQEDLVFGADLEEKGMFSAKSGGKRIKGFLSGL